MNRLAAVVFAGTLMGSTPAAFPADARPEPRDPSPLLGLYAVPASACSLVAASGFTLVRSPDLGDESPVDATAWSFRARSYLDTAHRHGLRVLLDLPTNWIHHHRANATTEAVRSVREHPALCAWIDGPRDEPRQLGSLQFIDRLIEAEDPVHGLVIDASLSGEAAIGMGRARLFRYEPVTRDSRRSSRLQTASERIASAGETRVPVWIAIQAFGEDLVRGSTRHDLVMPTRHEMETALASALAAGARGILFAPYLHPSVFGDHAAPGGKRGYGEYKPLPAFAPEAWESVRATSRLATRLLQALAGADHSEALRVARAPRGIEVGRWDTAGGTLVIIANGGRRAADIELACDEIPGAVDWITSPEHALQRDGRRLGLLVPPASGLAFMIRAPTP